jgi:hypothetical protein
MPFNSTKRGLKTDDDASDDDALDDDASDDDALDDVARNIWRAVRHGERPGHRARAPHHGGPHGRAVQVETS